MDGRDPFAVAVHAQLSSVHPSRIPYQSGSISRNADARCCDAPIFEAAAEIAVSKDDFEGLPCVQHGAGQTVREQPSKLCRIFGHVPLGEKGCAGEQFGGFGSEESSRRVLVRLLQAGDQRTRGVELENPFSN